MVALIFSKMVHKGEEGQNVQKTVHMVYEWPLGRIFALAFSLCADFFATILYRRSMSAKKKPQIFAENTGLFISQGNNSKSQKTTIKDIKPNVHITGM